jgi:hypothetical protein
MSSSLDDGDIQPPAGSTTANQQVYPQTRSMVPFPADNSVLYDMMQLQDPIGAFAQSQVDDNSNYHYASTIHPHASTSAVIDNSQPYLMTLPRYTEHSQSHVQPQESMLENEAYGLWAAPPSSLE